MPKPTRSTRQVLADIIRQQQQFAIDKALAKRLDKLDPERTQRPRPTHFISLPAQHPLWRDTGEILSPEQLKANSLSAFLDDPVQPAPSEEPLPSHHQRALDTQARMLVKRERTQGNPIDTDQLVFELAAKSWNRRAAYTAIKQAIDDYPPDESDKPLAHCPPTQPSPLTEQDKKDIASEILEHLHTPIEEDKPTPFPLTSTEQQALANYDSYRAAGRLRSGALTNTINDGYDISRERLHEIVRTLRPADANPAPAPSPPPTDLDQIIQNARNHARVEMACTVGARLSIDQVYSIIDKIAGDLKFKAHQNPKHSWRVNPYTIQLLEQLDEMTNERNILRDSITELKQSVAGPDTQQYREVARDRDRWRHVAGIARSALMVLAAETTSKWEFRKLAREAIDKTNERLEKGDGPLPTESTPHRLIPLERGAMVDICRSWMDSRSKTEAANEFIDMLEQRGLTFAYPEAAPAIGTTPLNLPLNTRPRARAGVRGTEQRVSKRVPNRRPNLQIDFAKGRIVRSDTGEVVTQQQMHHWLNRDDRTT